MKIMPVNNINKNHNIQFNAKFSKSNVKTFLNELQYKDIDDVPKLYTMLDIIKQQSGKNAKIKNLGCWYQIHIDGKSINGSRTYISAYHALEDAVVNHKNTLLKETPIKRVTEEEFENMWLKNANKTKQDIENIFKE